MPQTLECSILGPSSNGVHLYIVTRAIIEDNAVLGAREPLGIVGVNLQLYGCVPTNKVIACCLVAPFLWLRSKTQ